MSVATLHFAPWQAKSHLPPVKYASLTAAVSRVLFHTVSLPENKLDVAWTRAFIGSYAQDAATHALQVLDEKGGSNDTKPSPQELSIRNLTLQLAGRLARVPGGLGVPVLVDLAVAYGTGNATSMRAVVEDACQSTPSLLKEFKTEVVPAFRATLQNPESRSPTSIRKTAYALSQLLRCVPVGFTPFAEDREFVLALARCYQFGLDKLAASRGGMKLDSLKTVAAWQKDWLYAKTGLLDSFHAIIQTLIQSQHPKDVDRLFDVLFAILELPSSSTSHPGPATPFVSQSLLADYQYAFDLASVLSERFRGTDDARVDLLAATLAELSPPTHGTKSAGGLSVLLKDGPRVRSTIPASDSKGKAKATNQDPDRETVLDLAVSQVLDIFPAHTPQQIRHYLEHPAVDGNPELLISSLLEGTLPSELVDDVDAVQDNVHPKEEFEFIKDRRNAWDEDTMDFSRLRVGKTRDNADALLQDRSFIEQMKADIIRRAEELSDEEDEAAGKPRGRTVTFEEELDDDVESLVDKGVKVAGDGEGSDESDDEGDAADVAGPQMSSPETILELTYLEDPKLFDRDGATRRSKTRAELKAKTGWGDEQIEGWRIMLERNPKKDKILQKHEFAGNVPLAPNRSANEPGPSGSSHRGSGGDGRGKGRGGSRGGGGGGGGGGGRGGGGGDTARGRAWKDKNKARNANHNRKRGHDKKMARGGGGPPAQG